MPKPGYQHFIAKLKVLGYDRGDYYVLDLTTKSDRKYIVLKEAIETSFIKITKLSKLFYL